MATTLNAALRIKLVDEVSASARQVEERMEAIGRAASAGAAEASRAMDRTAAAARQLASAERVSAVEAARQASAVRSGAAAIPQLTVATQKSTEETRKSSRALAEKINLISEMSLGLGALNPRLQQLAISFAGAGNNAVQLSRFMGPVGIAVTSLITVLPGLIAFVRDLSSSLGDAASRAETARQRLDELREAERDAAEEREARARRARGEATSQEIDVELRALERRRAELLNEADEAMRRLDREQRQLAIRIAMGREQRTREQLITAMIAQRDRRLREALRTATGQRREAIEAALAGRGEHLLPSEWQRATIQRRVDAAVRAARRLAPIRQELGTIRPQIEEAREGLEAAIQREQEEARRARIAEAQRAASEARERLSALLVSRGAGLSPATRAAIARLEAEAAQGLLGTAAAQRRLARLRDPEIAAALQQIQAASVTAARATTGETTGETGGEAAPTQVERVARRVRAAERRPAETPATPQGPGQVSEESLRAFEEAIQRALSRPQRIEVNVRTEPGLRVEVDASASDLMGGQQ